MSLFSKFLKRETHDHLKFSPAGRAFIYLPLEHSENRESQVLRLFHSDSQCYFTFSSY